MMRHFLISIIIAFIAFSAFGQDKYFTRSGHVYFISHTDVIDIDGNSHQMGSILNIETGEMVFSVLIKSFKFTLATAEEHFNENYMESDLYPKSSFKGKITNIDEIDFTKDGNYNVMTEGGLTIHGVTNQVKKPGTLTVEDGKIIGNSEFIVNIDDYDITVPNVVKDRVAKEINVKINLTYEPYNR